MGRALARASYIPHMSEDAGMRASDAERELAAESLREHYGAGRLSAEELSDRLDAVYRATTVSELEGVRVDPSWEPKAASVSVVNDFMRKLQKMKPWLIRKEEKPVSEGEYLQTPEQLDAYKQFSMCINCMLCYAACPVYGLDPLFSGPAAIALAQRYNLDSRDQGAKDRFPVLSQHDAIWGCTFVGECTRVCPKHVDPAGAIQQYKLTAALDWVKSVVMPWGGK